jgi:hypothetical protein
MSLLRQQRPNITTAIMTQYDLPTLQLFVAGTRARTYSSLREHHMTNILTFFSTRTLLQIVFILGSAVALKAWSLGLL